MKFVASLFASSGCCDIGKVEPDIRKTAIFLEDLILIFEHLRPLLEHRITLLENEELIRTFQIILEKETRY